MNRIRTRSFLALAAVPLVLASAACKDRLVGTTPSILVTPDSVAFGQVMVGVHQMSWVSVSNEGSAPLAIDSIRVATDPNHELSLVEQLTTNCTNDSRSPTAPLAPGECARFAVVWSPIGSHAASGSIEIDSNDLQSPKVTLPVTGSSAAPALEYCLLDADGGVDPSACSDLGATPPVKPSIDLGAGSLNTTSSVNVRFTNRGTAQLTFAPPPALGTSSSTDLQLTGAIAGNRLAAGASADLAVSATPTTTGAITGVLQVDSNDLLAPALSIPISLQVAALPVIQVSPAALAFGSQQIGTPQQIRVSVSNVGTAPLLVSTIKVSSDPNSELRVDDLLTTDCHDVARSGGLTLLPGNCARFTAVWSPLAAHQAAGAIEVDSNDAQHPAVVLPVSGSATSPQLQVCVLTAAGALDTSACSDLSQTPHVVPSLAFGTLLPSTPATRTVRITNQGTAPLTFSPAPGLSAATSSAFALGGSIPGNALAPAAFADLTITADPTSAGSFAGALNLASNDLRAPTLPIALSATVEGYQLCVDNPAGLAFGQVNIGQAQSLGLTFTNCGSTPLAVTSFAFTPTSPTTTQFTISTGALPAAGTTIGVGAIIPLTITYRPTAVQGDAAAIGYALAAGGVALTGSVPITGSGTAPTCGSAGRPNPTISVATSYAISQSGTYTPFNPAAAPSPVIPLDWVKLAASATVSTGSPTWSWELTSQPAGSTASLSSTGNTSAVTLRALVSGAYVVTATAKDSYGCVSTDAVTFNIVPQGTIHIELTWAEGCGDLDLHYVAPGDNTTDNLVCYGNDIFYGDLPGSPYHGPGFPDWGCATSGGCNGAPSNPGGEFPDRITSDDASLDIDNVTGHGPENITQKTPFNSPAGTPYQVWVYYFADHGTCTNTHPTVNIYVDGLLRNSFTYSDSLLGTFTQAVLWHVADLAVSNRTSVSVSQPAVNDQTWYDAYDVCYCETPGNNGYTDPFCFR